MWDHRMSYSVPMEICWWKRLRRICVKRMKRDCIRRFWMPFTQAQSSLADIRQLNQLDVFIARFAQVFACFSVVQTSDFRLVDRSKIYCTLTSEDGTVDLSKLSVKAVRTDNKHASFDSRISGADLVEAGRTFFLCSRATDVSCNLDISYGSALLKKISS